LFALIPGRVQFERLDKTRQRVSIYPVAAPTSVTA
jgi:ribosomal protein L27